MAYDQSLVGVFPWTEDLPTSQDGAASYGGFKALAETAMLARHAESGFPGTVVRPAAIYGPDNNIFDMELPLFLRLLEHRPIIVPHGGLIVGSFGHVDDLCEAMVGLVGNPAAMGEVFNISGDSVTVNRYIEVLAEVVGEEPDVVYLPDEMLGDLPGTVFGHLFGVRHHAMLSIEKAQRLFGFAYRYDLRSGSRGHVRVVPRQGVCRCRGADGRSDVAGVVGLRRRSGGGEAGARCVSRPTRTCGGRWRQPCVTCCCRRSPTTGRG